MKKTLKKIGVAGLALSPAALFAQTDIPSVTSAVSGYVSAAITVGVTVMLFVIGRAVVRKLAK